MSAWDKLTIDGGSLDGKNEVSCGMGVAEVAVSRPADYGYALESGMGSVTIDNYSHSWHGRRAGSKPQRGHIL